MQRIFTSIIGIFITLASSAQNPNKSSADGVVAGKVIDKTSQKPLDYVSFRLFSTKDSAVVAGIFTDAEGKFTLEQLPYGRIYHQTN